MPRTNSPARRFRRLVAPWLVSGLVGLIAMAPSHALAACQIEYSDRLISAVSKATGQYVPKYHGNFSSLTECESARRDAIAKSGDPSLAMNMTCTSCSAAPQGKGSSSSPDIAAAAAAATAAKKKYEAQKKSEEQAAQQQFLRDKQKLSQELKGVTLTSGNTLVLKQTPPPTTSRQQLDCILRDSKKSESNDDLPPGGDWQNLRDCPPYDPAVPPVPKPMPVTGAAAPTDEAGARAILATLARQLTTTRQQLSRQEQEIMHLEQEVAQEESHQPVTGLKEAPRVSDALRRAREALARARAARQQTAEQLRHLEEQEKSPPRGQ
jgi:hypothetical protein